MAYVLEIMDRFLYGDFPEFRNPRDIARATQHLAVYRIDERYKLIRVCTLTEFRLAVSLIGALMAAHAADMLLEGEKLSRPWIPLDSIPNVLALKAVISQGDNPELIALALVLEDAKGSWPYGFSRLPGYVNGVRGYGMLSRVSWSGLPSLGLGQQSIRSVTPRARVALKHMAAQGYTLVHEALVNEVLQVMTATDRLLFLDL